MPFLGFWGAHGWVLITIPSVSYHPSVLSVQTVQPSDESPLDGAVWHHIEVDKPIWWLFEIGDPKNGRSTTLVNDLDDLGSFILRNTHLVVG